MEESPCKEKCFPQEKRGRLLGIEVLVIKNMDRRKVNIS